MAYDENLADRIRKVLARHKALTEKKMFGGVAFMLGGKMCCGVVKNDLVVRVGPEHHEEALAQPHARPMDFTGWPMKGFLFIGPAGYRTDEALAKWVKQAVEFVSTLPKNLNQSRKKEKFR